jgi:hypothetical protein
MALPQIPDFAALFTVCRCGKASCSTCAGFQLTPRTAAVLWSVAQVLADHGYDDIEEQGSGLLPERTEWYLFDRYPRLTWSQDAAWRRRAARAYDDLAADLAAGITVAISRSVTALQLNVALDSQASLTYRHLLPSGRIQQASAARRPE